MRGTTLTQAPLRRLSGEISLEGCWGDPIKKDKTFFFGGYEGLRQGLDTTLIATVPTALARQGILPTTDQRCR